MTETVMFSLCLFVGWFEAGSHALALAGLELTKEIHPPASAALRLWAFTTTAGNNTDFLGGQFPLRKRT